MKLAVMAVSLAFLLLLFACSPAGQNLEQKVQIEAYEFEQLIKGLQTHVSTIDYPQNVPFQQVIPKTWILDCKPDAGDFGEKSCLLAIPFECEVYTARVYPSCYVTSHGGTLRKTARVDELRSGTSFEVRRLQRATYSGYLIERPLLFRDKGADYGLPLMVGKMFDANPYQEKTALQEHITPSLAEIIKEIRAQMRVINEDIVTYVHFVEFLQVNYLRLAPAGCWDTQDEVSTYKQSMVQAQTKIDEIETYLQQIEGWDYSNLEKYRKKKQNPLFGMLPTSQNDPGNIGESSAATLAEKPKQPEQQTAATTAAGTMAFTKKSMRIPITASPSNIL